MKKYLSGLLTGTIATVCLLEWRYKHWPKWKISIAKL